jgi:hypothetical protein
MTSPAQRHNSAPQEGQQELMKTDSKVAQICNLRYVGGTDRRIVVQQPPAQNHENLPKI